MVERCYSIRQNVLQKIVDENGGLVAVAKKLGYTKQRVSKWLGGANRVPESAIKEICLTFGLDGSDLIADNMIPFIKIVYPRLTRVNL